MSRSLADTFRTVGKVWLAGFVHSTKIFGARAMGQTCAGCWGTEMKRGINTATQVLPGKWGESSGNEVLGGCHG